MEFVSKPCGPYKLAKALRDCIVRLKVAGSEHAGMKESDSLSESSSAQPKGLALGLKELNLVQTNGFDLGPQVSQDSDDDQSNDNDCRRYWRKTLFLSFSNDGAIRRQKTVDRHSRLSNLEKPRGSDPAAVSLPSGLSRRHQRHPTDLPASAPRG